MILSVFNLRANFAWNTIYFKTLFLVNKFRKIDAEVGSNKWVLKKFINANYNIPFGNQVDVNLMALERNYLFTIV
jgi:hypothetical protein